MDELSYALSRAVSVEEERELWRSHSIVVERQRDELRKVAGKLERALHSIRFTAQSAYLGFHHILDEHVDGADPPIPEQAAQAFYRLAQAACDALEIENAP